MKIQLSDHFTYGRLIRFTMPSILMTIFTSLYATVDGLFVSNLVGKTAFAALNLIYPYLIILGGVGAMLGVGGSALVAKTLGERNIPRAREYFTMMMYLMLLTSVAATVLGIAFLRPVAYLFGATENLMPDVMIYGTVCLIFNTALQAQYTFQSYLIVAEQPKLALWVVLAAGVTNMVLDYLFMAVIPMGIAGAALATGLSQCVAGAAPLIWFLSRKNTSALRFTKTRFELRPMLRSCANGASEMLSSISASVTGILYNLQLIRYAGEDGVAAYGVVMYVNMIFLAVYIGYSTGVAPVVSYHFGAKNHKELKNLFHRSLRITAVCSLLMFATGMLLADPLSRIFVGYDSALLAMTVRAFRVYSVSFLLSGVAIFASCFFTALNDGVTSAIISFMRTLVFQTAAVMVMPLLWGLDGIWWSVVGSEAMAMATAVFFFYRHRRKFHYAQS